MDYVKLPADRENVMRRLKRQSNIFCSREVTKQSLIGFNGEPLTADEELTS